MNEDLFANNDEEQDEEQQEQDQPVPDLEEFDEDELDDIFDKLQCGSSLPDRRTHNRSAASRTAPWSSPRGRFVRRPPRRSLCRRTCTAR
jgi:hypothetical protein